MKFQLKDKDLKDIERFLSHSPQAKLLKEYKKWSFDIGDVLVRYSVDSGGSKTLDVVSEVCPVPKKYRVVHIDELGVPWVKQLSVRGGLGNKMYCLMNYAHNYSWEIDPEQIEAILLGYKYDPRIEYKRMRNDNPEYGKRDETE